MARKAGRKADNGAKDYRHTEARRKNNPPAGLAPAYEAIKERETKPYPAYDPHLPPQLIWADKAGLKNVEWDSDKTSFDVGPLQRS